MKNLQLMTIHRRKLQQSSENASQIAANDEAIFSIKDNKLFVQKDSTETLVSPEEFHCVSALEYLSFENKLFFTTTNELVYYSLDSEDIRRIPLEETISCTSWNSTQETLAVVFENSAVATYNIDYESGTVRLLAKSDLSANVPQTVYVGWGSANTQFRGSEGKNKQNAPVDVKPVCDKTPRISWRGNGQMFAVNYSVNDTRTFKVFEDPCTPIFECEGVAGLQSAIAWRPEGNMIAVPVCVNDRYSVVIFEKNGYKRFEFTLAYANYEVLDLKWSPEGEILSVHQRNEAGEHSLSLYTTSNYKWYLKQHLQFSKIINFNWVIFTKAQFCLRVTTSDVLTYAFKYAVDVCTKFGAICGVIDGFSLRLTPFKHTSLPPPMYDRSLTTTSAINSVCFHPNKPVFCVVDCLNALSIYDYSNEEALVKVYSKKVVVDSYGGVPLSFRSFHWNGDRLCCVCAFFARSDESAIVDIGSVNSGDEDVKILEMVESSTNIEVVPNTNMKMYHCASKINLKDDEQNLLSITLSIAPIKIAAQIISETPYVFSLNPYNGFYINDSPVAKNVTSFIVHDSYLLLTTTLGRLFCIRLIKTQIEKLQTVSLTDDFFSRAIEQGGTLISAIPDTPIVILQIPRGNLEIISCRLIAVDILEDLLRKGEWKEALGFIRTDRLNSNLLIDLDPHRFVDNIEKFVDACETAAALNAFCQEIEDANVLNTIYAKCCLKPYDELKNKRRAICYEILKYLEQIDYAYYISTLVIISVYHFSIENALMYVQDLLERSKTDETMLKIATVAVKTLNIHAKREDLFEKALSLYDLELARFVAGFSQMDPKSYEPFLKELSPLAEVDRRFKINVFLKKPEVAIKYLLRTPEVDPDFALNFIKTHNVAEIAFRNLQKGSALFKEVSQILGDKLSSKSKHDEAALIYARAELLNDAFREYKLACNWQKAIASVWKLEISDGDRYRLIAEVAEELAKKGDYLNASRVYEEYLQNFEKAIQLLTKMYYFKEAIFLAEKHNRPDFVVIDIIPAIHQYCKHLIEEAGIFHGMFNRNKTRLETVRKERIAKYKNLTGGFTDGEILEYGGHTQNDVDLFSDAGSQTTATSTSSRRSTGSRKRRKEERKKLDLRVGGVYEDIALMRTLYGMIMAIFKMGNDFRAVCEILLERGFLKTAAELQKLLKDVQDDVKDSLRIIWPECFKEGHQCTTVEERAVNENFFALDVEFRRPPVYDDTKWQLSVLNV